jgi:hypothetical protein
MVSAMMGPMPGSWSKPHGVGIAGQQRLGLSFDVVALAYQVAAFGENQPEHRDSRRVGPYRQGDGRACGLVDIAQQACLGDLSANHVPRDLHERILGEGSDDGRCWKLLEQRQEPVAARVAWNRSATGKYSGR